MDFASTVNLENRRLLLAFWHIQYYIIQYFAIVLNVNTYKIVNNNNNNNNIEITFLFLILTDRSFGILNVAFDTSRHLFLFKVKYGNASTMCEICTKLTIKTAE